VRVVEIPSWEPLAGLQGWTELAAHCDASPFSWPSFCLPWWHEVVQGRLVSIGVEESGVLVGLALVYIRGGDVGRHPMRFVGHGEGTYQQLLVADDRRDVAALLWERLLSSDRQIYLASIPSDVAHCYVTSAPSSLALVEHRTAGFITTPLDGVTLGTPRHAGSIRQVTNPDECIELLMRPGEVVRWGAGAPGSREAAFFASAVHASARAGRITLHVATQPQDSAIGLLVLHGSRTSVVWHHAGWAGHQTDPVLAQSAMTDAAERGSRRLLCPDSCAVSGEPFPLSDITRSHRGGYLGEISVMARTFARSIRTMAGGGSDDAAPART
jgi:hypothetical protein